MEFRLQAECCIDYRFRLKAELHASLLIEPSPAYKMSPHQPGCEVILRSLKS